jgi:nicotinamide-nucleotide amidase
VPATQTTAAILSIGDELALGQILDTNSQWIADRLLTLGVRTAEHLTVDDDLASLTEAIRRLAERHALLVCTGGLGPTADDLTRQALAAAMGETLIEDPDALAHIEAWFAGRGGMPATNRVQALRPRSSRCLPNPHGTAPGLAAVLGSARVFCLPGPPHEMTPMFESFVAPEVATRDRAVRTRTVLTFGLGESRVAEILGPLMDRDRPSRGLPLVGTTASRGVVSCRLRVEAPTAEQADAALDATEAEVTALLGPAVFDRRDPASGDSPDIADALQRALLALLRGRGERIAVVESCTGGLIGAELASVPGSSEAFAGGWVTYSNEMKIALGVPREIIERHGAVSGTCAIAMARAGLERAHAADPSCAHAVAVTGIAGPGGGSEDKPVGTVWIAVAGLDGPAEARRFRFRGGRDAVRGWAARAALGLLRLRLIGREMPLLGEVERLASA